MNRCTGDFDVEDSSDEDNEDNDLLGGDDDDDDDDDYGIKDEILGLSKSAQDGPSYSAPSVRSRNGASAGQRARVSRRKEPADEDDGDAEVV
jgi:hypothetical protein